MGDSCLFLYRFIEVCMQRIIGFGNEPCDGGVMDFKINFALPILLLCIS